jgi:PAP2 superfamily
MVLPPQIGLTTTSTSPGESENAALNTSFPTPPEPQVNGYPNGATWAGKTLRWKYDPLAMAFAAWSVCLLIVWKYGNADITWAFLPSIYFQFRSKASPTHWLLSAVLGLPILFIHSGALALFALALGCITVTAYRVTKGEAPFSNLLPLLMVYFTVCVGLMHAVVLHFTPHTIDATMLSLDHRWFSDVSTATWHWAQGHLLVNGFFAFIYYSLPCVAVLILASLDNSKIFRSIAVLLMAAVCAVPFYLLFPAVGPALKTDPSAPRNCLPSLHVTWAILLWRATKPGWAKYAMALFALLTAVATLTTGQHYLIDLIVALPLAGCWMLAMPKRPGADSCRA